MPRHAALLCLLLLLPAPLDAQGKRPIRTDTVAAVPAGREPVVFSISGGISLGAYQAGVNWALLQAFQQAERVAGYPIRRVHISTVTGASAGNINTLFWAGEWCRELPATGPLPGPETTLFWEMWVERADLRGLLPEELPDSAELGLFNRAALLDSLGPAFDETFRSTRASDCELPIGLTITSVVPDTLWMPNADRFPIQTQRFAAFFQAHNDDVGSDWALRFHRLRLKDAQVQPRFGMIYPIEDSIIPFAHVLDIVKASSSFPVAFSPVSLPYRGGRRLFMDGGVFDNNPVSLALLLYGNTVPDPPRPTLVYVNPGRMRQERRDTNAGANDSTRGGGNAAVIGGFTPALRMAQGAIGSARQYELQLLARDKAVLEANPRWVFSDRRAPLIGDHLGAFAAFIAHAFREYDFYVGLYDGLLLLAREFSECRPGVRDCLEARVEALRADADLSLPPAATPLLDILHEEEFGDANALERRCAASDWSDLQPDQAVSVAVACALEQRVDDPKCTPSDLASWVACADGIQPVLASLSERRAVFERCAEACTDPRRRLEADSLAEWIDNPAASGARLVDRVLERAIEVEQRAGATVRESTGFEAPLEGIAALYYGSGLRRGQHTSSLPPAAGSWWRLLPTSITGGVRESALDARWETIWRSYSGALVFHYNEDPRAENAAYPNLGLALGVSTQWPWTDIGIMRFIVNRWGAQAEMFSGDLGEAMDGNLDPFPAFYGFADALLGKLRIAYRYTPDAGLLHGPDRHGFMIGVSDVVGLAYWAVHLGGSPAE